eukprot:6207595-Pleurochrysis_carterae.AAC.1
MEGGAGTGEADQTFLSPTMLVTAVTPSQKGSAKPARSIIKHGSAMISPSVLVNAVTPARPALLAMVDELNARVLCREREISVLEAVHAQRESRSKQEVAAAAARAREQAIQEMEAKHLKERVRFQASQVQARFKKQIPVSFTP